MRLYVDLVATWQYADGSWGVRREPMQPVRGVSRRHVLNKALRRVRDWPCVADREGTQDPAQIEVTIVDPAAEGAAP